MKRAKRVKRTLRLPVPLAQALEEIAVRRGLSANSLLIVWIGEKVESEEAKYGQVAGRCTEASPSAAV